jgi:hypothetical protein
MDTRIETISSQLATTATNSVAAFGGLSGTQLNWKPGEKTWSVAQCLDHLITTHSLYFPELERLAMGTAAQSFWQSYSPLSGFFGRFLIKSLDPKNSKKMKTTAKASPSSSEIGDDIVRRFFEHQHQLIDAIKKLPETLDLSKTIVTSPLLGFVTYSLEDTFTFLPLHCERHFGQAKRVMEAEGFPS